MNGEEKLTSLCDLFPVVITAEETHGSGFLVSVPEGVTLHVCNKPQDDGFPFRGHSARTIAEAVEAFWRKITPREVHPDRRIRIWVLGYYVGTYTWDGECWSKIIADGT